MSKIYEALLRAEQERDEKGPVLPPASPRAHLAEAQALQPGSFQPQPPEAKPFDAKPFDVQAFEAQRSMHQPFIAPNDHLNTIASASAAPARDASYIDFDPTRVAVRHWDPMLETAPGRR